MHARNKQENRNNVAGLVPAIRLLELCGVAHDRIARALVEARVARGVVRVAGDDFAFRIGDRRFRRWIALAGQHVGDWVIVFLAMVEAGDEGVGPVQPGHKQWIAVLEYSDGAVLDVGKGVDTRAFILRQAHVVLPVAFRGGQARHIKLATAPT